MKLFLPNNVFTQILINNIPKEIEIIFRPSSLLSKDLEIFTQAVSLIPSLDLINHRTFFASSKIGISFDGLLSNSYFYFIEDQKKFEKIFLQGDVSINEFILSKILFEEKYSSQIDLILDTKTDFLTNQNYIVCGDDNFKKNYFHKGISFADEIADLLNLPFVNYLFVSQDKDQLIEFQNLFSDLDLKIENSLSSSLERIGFNFEAKNFIIENIGSVYYEVTENEVDAFNELIKLIYYHGIVDDMFDVKFL
ncbi:MAG: hypothetical protein N2321_07535 [Melioribacteraceae bacterium]|nr:hypothetical protein [Melioribacteraceae bacterium]